MLPQKHRLPSFELSRVMRNGRRIVGNGITVLMDSRESDSRNLLENSANDSGNRSHSGNKAARFAFVVSTKVDKRAVVRNRIRRLLSESVRHLIDTLPSSIDYVIISGRQLVGISQKEIVARLYEILCS